jgi:hypothetical protein
VNVAHDHRHGGLGPARLRIALASLESEDTKVAELSGKVSFGALCCLNSTR